MTTHLFLEFLTFKKKLANIMSFAKPPSPSFTCCKATIQAFRDNKYVREWKHLQPDGTKLYMTDVNKTQTHVRP